MNHKKISISYQVQKTIPKDIQKLLILLSKQIPTYEEFHLFSLTLVNQNKICVTHYLPSRNYKYHLEYFPITSFPLTELTLILLNNATHYALLTHEEFHSIVS